MEVCVDSVESAINAEKGGACRVELCANLMEGGTSPSIGMLRVMKKHVAIPVYVMIRPRGGDFLYTDLELEVMKTDLENLKEAGADGAVIGLLTRDGGVDIERSRELIDIAKPLPVTFHRAIDMCRDIRQAMEDIIELGCERILTSGGECSALEGAPVIAVMIEQAADRIIIVPGGGINERNVGRILESTGAKEFHGSARTSVPSVMTYQKSGISMGAALSSPEFSRKISDAGKVKQFLTVARVSGKR